MNTVPHSPFPIGWFLLVSSDRVRSGEVLRLRRFGRELVVFRDRAGNVGVADAHCPHMGADLGGGSVVGNELQCPFHGFRFTADGSCVHVPHCERIPPRLRLRSWEIREVNGAVFAWFHPSGDPPSFEIPQIREVTDAAWSRPTFGSTVVRTHVQEVTENGIDFSHTWFLHRAIARPPTADARRTSFDGHVFRSYAEAPSEIVPLFPCDTTMDIEFHGIGFGLDRLITRHRTTGKVIVETLAAVFATPIDAEQVELTFMLCYRKPRALLFGTRAVQAVLFRRMEYEFERDRVILDRKIYLEHPSLVPTDGPVPQFRSWASAFYV